MCSLHALLLLCNHLLIFSTLHIHLVSSVLSFLCRVFPVTIQSTFTSVTSSKYEVFNWMYMTKLTLQKVYVFFILFLLPSVYFSVQCHSDFPLLIICCHTSLLRSPWLDSCIVRYWNAITCSVIFSPTTSLHLRGSLWVLSNI